MGWGRRGRWRAAEKEGERPGEREGKRERGVAAGGEGGSREGGQQTHEQAQLECMAVAIYRFLACPGNLEFPRQKNIRKLERQVERKWWQDLSPNFQLPTFVDS